ncbi:MAG: hypothetical protein ACRD1Q_17210 [Vicinamibacterales bacterium]
MTGHRQDDPEAEGAEQGPHEVCTVCRQVVPLRHIITMMARPVCLNCAATFYEADEEGE